MLRLRSKYPKRTYAKFATRYEGPGWESEDIAWRIYFDARNAIDLYGKRRPGLYLDLFSSPEYVYHMEGPFGRDIYGIGKALGVAGIGALVDGKALPVAEVADRKWRIASSGPVRSVLELEYKGWKIAGKHRGSHQPHHAMGRRAWLRPSHRDLQCRWLDARHRPPV